MSSVTRSTTYRYPETSVLYRSLTRSFPKIIRGEGVYLYDETGKRYLDGSGGAYVANLGHGVSEIADMVATQMRKVAYVTGTAFTNEPAEELAAELASLSPGELDKFYFLTSGSDANEAALKLARQHWVEMGRPSKHKVIALVPAYHGNTLFTLSMSSREEAKENFRPWLVPGVQMPAPYSYRCGCAGDPICPRCTGTLLDEVIARECADTVAAFIGETVGGSSTGASVPRAEYWRTIRDICDRHRLLWIADEILVGAGRTGTWTAVEQYDALPDLLVLGKGLSGGYAALAAVATSERVLAPIAKRSGSLSHNQTFSHAPMMCAAGLAAVRYLKAHGLVDKCRSMAPTFHRKLTALGGLPFIGDIRGRGLLAGIEFVEDQKAKRPFDRRLRFAETFAAAALEAGLVVWPNVGHADGLRGDLVCLAPPFVVSESEIDELVALMSQALQITIDQLALS